MSLCRLSEPKFVMEYGELRRDCEIGVHGENLASIPIPERNIRLVAIVHMRLRCDYIWAIYTYSC